MVNSFDEFCEELIKSEFLMGGGNQSAKESVYYYVWKKAKVQPHRKQ